MLGYLFGFNARIGRLAYFLSSIGLGVAMTAIIFVIAKMAYFGNAKAIPLTVGAMPWALIGLAVAFLFATFTLQAMRIRDIGWDPVCVIPAWIAIMLIDYVIALKFPSLSMGREHGGTIIGSLTNLALTVALLFLPTRHEEEPPPRFGVPSATPDSGPRRQDAGSAAASRMARIAGG